MNGRTHGRSVGMSVRVDVIDDGSVNLFKNIGACGVTWINIPLNHFAILTHAHTDGY